MEHPIEFTEFCISEVRRSGHGTRSQGQQAQAEAQQGCPEEVLAACGYLVQWNSSWEYDVDIRNKEIYRNVTQCHKIECRIFSRYNGDTMAI